MIRRVMRQIENGILARNDSQEAFAGGLVPHGDGLVFGPRQNDRVAAGKAGTHDEVGVQLKSATQGSRSP